MNCSVGSPMNILPPNKELRTNMMYKLYDRRYNLILKEHSNDFTEIACELCPQTKQLLDIMKDGSIESGVTGKGPTVFAGYATFHECAEVGASIKGWFGGRIFIGEPTEQFITLLQ